MVLRTEEPSYFVPAAEFLTDEPQPRSLIVRSVRTHHRKLLVAFEEYPDRNAVEELRETALTIARHDLAPRPAGEYHPADLLGLEARHVTGGRLGTVTAVHPGVGQDRLVVATTDGEVEVPFVDELVPRVDIDAGYLVIDPPAGLF